MSFLTREVFDALIVFVIVTGAAVAFLRLWQDVRRKDK